MPLTQLDPKAALVAIDLQQGIVSMPTAHPTAEIVARAADIARGFRAHGLTVVWVNVNGLAPGRTDLQRAARAFPPGWDTLVPALGQTPTDLRITKQRPGAFWGTGLDAVLRERGVTQIILTGVSTSNGVEATARSAYDLGYHLVFVADAVTDASAQMHEHSLGKVFPRLGEVCSTAELLQRLGERSKAVQ